MLLKSVAAMLAGLYTAVQATPMNDLVERGYYDGCPAGTAIVRVYVSTNVVVYPCVVNQFFEENRVINVGGITININNAPTTLVTTVSATSTVTVTSTVTEDTGAVATPFILSIVDVTLVGKKRQASQFFLAAGGSVVSSCSLAQQFTITGGALFSGGLQVSTNPGVASQIFATASIVGNIAGSFRGDPFSWQNPAFFRGAASFCELRGILYAVFSSTPPAGCTPKIPTIVPAAACNGGTVSTTSAVVVTSSTSGVVAPTTSGVVAPTTSGVVAPTTSGVVAPTTSGVVAPTTSGVVAPTTSGVVAPTTTSGVVAPTTTSGVVAPTTTSVPAPSTTSSAASSTTSGALQCLVNGVVVPTSQLLADSTLLSNLAANIPAAIASLTSGLSVNALNGVTAGTPLAAILAALQDAVNCLSTGLITVPAALLTCVSPTYLGSVPALIGCIIGSLSGLTSTAIPGVISAVQAIVTALGLLIVPDPTVTLGSIPVLGPLLTALTALL